MTALALAEPLFRASPRGTGIFSVPQRVQLPSLTQTRHPARISTVDILFGR